MLLGKINFSNLLDYTIQPSDMELFQSYMQGPFQARLASERTKGLLFGGIISVVSNLQLSISAGMAIMPDGTVVAFDASTVTLGAADSTNARIDRIELSYALVTNTTTVNNLSQSVVLDQLYKGTVVVIPGVASVAPAIPSQTSSNLSLGYVTVPAAAGVLIAGNISQIVDSGYEISAIQLGNKNGFIRFNPSTGTMQFQNFSSGWQSIGGGGGGGGSAVWEPVDGLAPLTAIEYNQRALVFEQGAGQTAALAIHVPSSYLPGSKVTMKLDHYSPGNSGVWRFLATVTLIRKNTDAISSTANQYVSTNSDVTNSAANLLREISYDLSSPTGLVGGVSISPGDLLICQLSRVTPSGTEDSNSVRMIQSSTEVSFS